ELEPVERNFLYMPYMHSESAVIHEVAEQLFRDNSMARSYEYERKHQAIQLGVFVPPLFRSKFIEPEVQDLFMGHIDFIPALIAQGVPHNASRV
ncbi:MAG: DUF924 family protein, partial [Desulfuromonadales bacterium]